MHKKYNILNHKLHEIIQGFYYSNSCVLCNEFIYQNYNLKYCKNLENAFIQVLLIFLKLNTPTYDWFEQMGQKLVETLIFKVHPLHCSFCLLFNERHLIDQCFSNLLVLRTSNLECR